MSEKVEPKQETAAERRAKESQARRQAGERRPEEVKGGVVPDGDEPEARVVTREKMLNLPEKTGIGAIRLSLKAVPSRRVTELTDLIIKAWPDVLICAARVPPLPGGRLDVDSIAAFINVVNEGKLETVSAPLVTQWLCKAEENIEQSIGAMCDALWLVASDTPHVAWPKPEAANGETVAPPPGKKWLDEYLLDHLTLPDYVRLPRLILQANSVGGGDIHDLDQRFFDAWQPV